MFNEGIFRLAMRTYGNMRGFVFFLFLHTTIVIASSSVWRHFRTSVLGSYPAKLFAASVSGVILGFGWWGVPTMLSRTTQIDYYVNDSEFLAYFYPFMMFCVWVVISVECEAYLSTRRLTAVQRFANA